ncbi:P-loop containing nucleoside triphosphate hydrolase protein [Mycena maculata]|uniref:DNA 3'-5' helicase n=1 Tax=Mycena maculata TaxID=230809 RepID=A0AAD7JME0_9AGAR|nr:P-loop containing nucleoside triphosphate hydrolase protein [Mycena maculata]
MCAAAFVVALVLLLLLEVCASFKFYSEPGFALVRKILLEALPNFEPHHYQMDGICKVLDGIDLIAVTPTGSGKTGYLFLSILVMITISKMPSLCPSVKFPKDPAIVVVCPTNSIEGQMEDSMGKLGISALALNSDTVGAGRIRGEDLWIKARAGVSILGPEQLISKGFRDLLAFQPFYDRVCALGVDEIHLLVLWGLGFCKPFLQIGFMRARFRTEIPLIGLTATLLADPKVQNAIFSLLGVNRGEFHLIRRSNARHDVQLLFRQLYSGIDGHSFPEIAWVLDTRDKTLIFENTIGLVHRLKSYLNEALSIDSNRDIRIWTYTGLDWADNKRQTLSDFVDDPDCQIIIATNSLAQGNDIKAIETVIHIGEPESCTYKNPVATRMELAAKIVRQTDAENEADAKKAGTSGPRMSRSTAEVLTAKCKPAEQDHQFDNPPSDSPCPCKTCTASPPTPRPELCRCSDCTPEPRSHEHYKPPAKKKKAPSDIPAGKRLTKIMKESGRSRLEEFRLFVWSEASDRNMGLIPLAEFLPDVVITQLLDRFAKIETATDLTPFISSIAGLAGYHGQLFEVLVELGKEFKKMKSLKGAAQKK